MTATSVSRTLCVFSGNMVSFIMIASSPHRAAHRLSVRHKVQEVFSRHPQGVNNACALIRVRYDVELSIEKIEPLLTKLGNKHFLQRDVNDSFLAVMSDFFNPEKHIGFDETVERRDSATTVNKQHACLYAYVRKDNKLYAFYGFGDNPFQEIHLSKDELIEFDRQFLPTFKLKILTEEQLATIAKLIEHDFNRVEPSCSKSYRDTNYVLKLPPSIARGSHQYEELLERLRHEIVACPEGNKVTLLKKFGGHKLFCFTSSSLSQQWMDETVEKLVQQLFSPEPKLTKELCMPR